MSKKQSFDDWSNDQQRRNHKIKHSKNIPGKGMRVINNLYDIDSDIEEELYLELNDEVQNTIR